MIVLAMSVGAAGCLLTEEDTASADGRIVQGDETSAVLKSTLVLDTGCTATKVGPRHLLMAARCVSGNAAFAAGKTISFKVASDLRAAPEKDGDGKTLAPEVDMTAPDAAADADASNDDANGSKKNTSSREVTIEDVKINASYEAKCSETPAACAFGTLTASDAKDIAVVILDADLDTVPSIPIDLDTVGQSDTLLAVGSGCETFDGTPVGVKTWTTAAVPPKSVNHSGSAYLQHPALVTRLGAGYVVTPGQAWRPTGAPHVCQSDIGAPLFRSGQAAVVGVTSNYTTFDAAQIVPVTLHHAKVDTVSKVGPWLASLGVETTHSCSESPDGCTKNGYDGGAPGTSKTVNGGSTTVPTEDDAGDVVAPTEQDAGPVSTDLPRQGEEAPLPESEEEYTPRSNSGDDYDAGPKKKKKAPASGCSAAPGSTSGSDGLLIGLGLAIGAVVARRRRLA